MDMAKIHNITKILKYNILIVIINMVMLMLYYLNETLGLSAKESEWATAKKLPLYLKNGREYSVLELNHVQVLVISMNESSFNMSVFKKQVHKIREYWQDEIVLCFKKLTNYQRKALIEQGLPFIVPGSQIYVPFLGIILQEKRKTQRKVISRFTPSSQVVFLHLLYQKNSNHLLSKADISRKLGISAMNVTRAVQELEELGFVKIERSGRKDYVSLLDQKKEAYKKALPYMIDPVQKKVFVKHQDVFDSLPLCGESALSEKTMLNPPAILSKAIYKKDYKNMKNIGTVDPAWSVETDYIELEVWKYDPKLFEKNGVIDEISLAVSLSTIKDERIEMMVEEMLEAYFNGSWI